MKINLEITDIAGGTISAFYTKEDSSLIHLEIKGVVGGKKRIMKQAYKREELESLALAILEQRDRRFGL